jgi:type II secretory ATPase GspE/PulE/Tfp pilus assembly ATPase PilB-like protein
MLLASPAALRGVKAAARAVVKNTARATQDDPTELDGNIIALTNHIIQEAVARKVSDVHIEPDHDETRVRFRLDGVLHTVFTIPRAIHGSVIGRFKVLAGLKSDERRRPQDGRIGLTGAHDISLRISTIPTLFGEKVTLRVMDERNKTLSVNDLGLAAADRRTLLKNIEKPFGMIVACGPTGSGKTTTLYALLNLLRTDGVNISTLEDPIEYALPGVNQVQINTAVDLRFASGLRSLLRQDPDIIMVGEIRDPETASMASSAAMTGHLVLTTLHTNDAPSAITRLLEMKVEDFIVGSTLNAVIAQRLVRTVCRNCATETRLDSLTLRKLEERKDIVRALADAEHGAAQNLASRQFIAGAGCDACSYTGYAGRVGIYEVLELSRTLRDLVLTHASAERIKAAAEKEGFRTMVTDGVAKVLAGTTTIAEILRTTRNE